MDSALQLARAAGLAKADIAASSLLAVVNLGVLVASLVLGASLSSAIAVFSISTFFSQLSGAFALRTFVARHFAAHPLVTDHS